MPDSNTMKTSSQRRLDFITRSAIGANSISSEKKSPTGSGSQDPNSFGFETKMIHAGSRPDAETGARATPIYQNTAYVFESTDHAASLFNLQTFGNIYGRLSNPTTAVLEERLTSLEGGRGATCTASGHSAQLLTLFILMQPGDSVLASTRLYGGSITQLGKTILKFGWKCVFVDADDEEAVKKALNDPDHNFKLVWAESLANPGGVVTDMEMLAGLAHDHGIPLVIDNTMATPYLCRPFEWGADLIVHSTTKFLSGHGNAMGGCVIDSGKFNWAQSLEKTISGKPDHKPHHKFPSLTEPQPAYQGLAFLETFGDLAFTTFAHAVGLRDLGPTMAPMNAFLTITGCETLSLRMQQHCRNAQRVAEFLQKHERVEWVSYAGLSSDRYHQRAKKYMRDGVGGSVFTFGLKGGYAAGVKCVESCELFSHLANIGDTRSLILHPASTTHGQLTPAQRAAAGAGDEVLRVSIGLETAEDLICDLERALKKATA